MASLSTEISIRPARLEEAADLARLMGEGLNSRLNDLGPWFSTYLHRHFIESDHALCLVAERAGRRAGYAVFLVDRDRFYAEFKRRKGIAAGFMVLPWLLLPRNLATAVSGFFYSGRAHDADPAAELVSIVVAPEARRAGVGLVLTSAGIDALRDRGVAALKVTTPPDNAPANAMYARLGFEYVRTEPLYRNTPVNVYRYRLGRSAD
jgi:ribosomal-protein-alanine N-acetyltransferase